MPTQTQYRYCYFYSMKSVYIKNVSPHLSSYKFICQKLTIHSLDLYLKTFLVLQFYNFLYKIYLLPFWASSNYQSGSWTVCYCDIIFLEKNKKEKRRTVFVCVLFNLLWVQNETCIPLKLSQSIKKTAVGRLNYRTIELSNRTAVRLPSPRTRDTHTCNQALGNML